MHDQPVPDRRLVLAVSWCTAASFSALFTSGVFELQASVGGRPGDYNAALGTYTLVATVIIALLVLRLAPGRGWSWLLAVGAILSLPVPLGLLSRRMFDSWPEELLTVLVVAGPGLVLLGALGAAAWVWTAGEPGPAAVLAGATLAVPYLGTLTILLMVSDRSDWIADVLAVLYGLGVLGALATVVLTARSSVPVPAPGWRLTGCAALAEVLPLAQVWFPADSTAKLVVTGAVMLALVLLLAFLADPWIAPGALLVILVNLALFLGATVSVIGAITRAPELAAPAALVGIGIGWLMSASRHRAAVGLVGLSICCAALFLSPTENARDASGVALAAVMVIVWAVAGLSASATVAGTLRAPAHLPAAFGAFAPVAGVAVIDLLTCFYRAPTGSGREADQILIGVTLLIAIAGLAGLLLWRRRQSSTVTSSEPAA